MKIADTAIRRPVFAVMMIGALVVFGIFSYPRVGVDLMPEVEFPFVTVSVVYPGADPVAMESKVADKIEAEINTMSGIKMLRSTCLESILLIYVQFELDVDLDQAAQDIRDKISALRRDLPSGIDPPTVQKLNIGAIPVMSVALSSEMPVRDLTKIAKDVVKDRLQKVPGAGEVEIIGGREREIHVLVDPAKLAGRGFTVEDIANALRAGNMELPAGHIEEGQYELTVKTKGEVRSTEEIADIIISGLGGALVRIGDVATVVDGSEEARSWSSMNGVSSVALQIRKQSGANTVAVADLAREEVSKMSPELAKKGIKMSIAMDGSTWIKKSIEEVFFDLIYGAILAVVVILFFLHDWRATLISAVAIPSSLIATIAFIDFMGFTFNVITMMAMSVSIGILIDDAIVVIENIHRHRSQGKEAQEAASVGTDEIGLAVLATTASICAVFIPVAFMKGIIGRFFYQFGLTVSFTILVSTLIAVSLTPMLASRLLRAESEKRPMIAFRAITRMLEALNRGYRRVLAWCIKNALTRAVTIIIAIGALVGSCALAAQVDKEFFPPEDRSEFLVTVELPTGSSLAITRDYVEAVAADLRKSAPSVRETFVTVGGGARGQVNQGSIHVVIDKVAQRNFQQQDLMAWIRERYSHVTDVTIGVAEYNAMQGETGFRSQAIQYNIRGRNLDELDKAAHELIAALKKVPGFVDLDTTSRAGKPELAIEIDRERAADLGVPVAAIATTFRALIAGDKVSELKDGLDIYDVTIQMPESDKTGIEQLGNLKVRSVTGQLVDLSNVVHVKRATGPSQIEREKRQRQVTVLANLEGLPLGAAQEKVDEIAAKVLPKSLSTEYTGMVQVMQESFYYMAVALTLAVIFVYMLLAAQFNSFLHPFTIMLSLPLSVVGAFGGLYLAGMTLNMLSYIGIIMLMGLVCKNGILLVDYTNTLRARGMDVREALLTAGPVRLRPILMTTCAMIFGMLPIALAMGEGGASRAPMAVCVIGGLITSTVLTLIVVPVVYIIFDALVSSRLFRWLGGRIFVSSGKPAPQPAHHGGEDGA